MDWDPSPPQSAFLLLGVTSVLFPVPGTLWREEAGEEQSSHSGPAAIPDHVISSGSSALDYELIIDSLGAVAFWILGAG